MKLIILDRDGVINYDSEKYIKSPDEWLPIPDSLEAISLLNHKGFTISIATNQSGINRGYYSHETLSAIHEKMHDSLNAVDGIIDSVFYCPHTPDEQCSCRKPQPGLLLQIAKHYQITLTNVPFVGDSYRDLEAAIAATCQPVLVKSGNGMETLQQQDLATTPVFNNLMDFAKSL